MNPDYTWLLILGAIGVALFGFGKAALIFLDLKDRIAGEPGEPLHNPSIDKKIGDTVERSESRTARVIGQAKAEAHSEVCALEEKISKEINHLHGRVSNLRDELRVDYKALESKVQSGVDRMNETYNKTVDRMAKVEADTAHQERRIIAHESKLDRHIEKGCPALNASKS
jgi:hypothetical protein